MRMNLRYFVFLCALIMTVSCARQTSVVEELDAACSACFPAGEPGAEVLLMIGDSVVYDRGFGLADLNSREPISGETFFNIASCSKQFTAVAVLQLAEAGLLSLDDSLSAYFPEFSSPVWNRVKIRHLLSHSSGIPDLRGYLTRDQKINGDEALATEYLPSLDTLRFEPGTAYEYINPTFVLLGLLVERVAGVPFTDYVRDRIFLPAGMEQTLYFDRYHQDLIPHMAHGYEYADVSDMPEERTADQQNTPSEKNWYEYDFGEETFFATRPDGGIYTSAHELVRWEQYLRRKLLSSALLAQAMTPQTLVSGSPWSDYQNRPDTYYGYGWFLETADPSLPPSCIYHTGDNGGFKILVARYPELQALLLILANRADWDRYALKTRIEQIAGLK